MTLPKETIKASINPKEINKSMNYQRIHNNPLKEV